MTPEQELMVEKQVAETRARLTPEQNLELDTIAHELTQQRPGLTSTQALTAFIAEVGRLKKAGVQVEQLASHMRQWEVNRIKELFKNPKWREEYEAALNAEKPKNESPYRFKINTTVYFPEKASRRSPRRRPK